MLRRVFSEDSVSKIGNNYQEFYGQAHLGIEVVVPIEFDDDEENNRFVVREHYRIPEFWEKSTDGETTVKAEIRASVLGNSLDYPKKQRRRHPYWIIHPKDITQIVDVKFPNKWKTDASSMPIEHQAFRYDGKVTPRDDGYRGEYHYASLASEVQAKDFESYHSGMEQISDDLSLYLTHKAHHKTRMEARTIQWLPIPNHRLTSATCSSGFPPASDCLPALVLPRGCISMIQFHGSRCLGTRMGLADG